MTKYLLSISATIIISMSLFGQVMADEGDYYEGVTRSVGASIDPRTTSSITVHKSQHGFTRNGGGRDNNWPNFVDQGDYYQGASRSN
ncbi:hypothetical protein [Neorhizobium tomejilense]|jgi:hypothetical protein|uniref:hypothetical protein n=1 Tax=Neorhizobium tomejilense TaxID=2093828 RepID=UPI003ECD3B31